MYDKITVRLTSISTEDTTTVSLHFASPRIEKGAKSFSQTMGLTGTDCRITLPASVPVLNISNDPKINAAMITKHINNNIRIWH